MFFIFINNYTKKSSINTHKTIKNQISINYYSIIRIELYSYNVLSYELILLNNIKTIFY